MGITDIINDQNKYQFIKFSDPSIFTMSPISQNFRKVFTY